MGRTSVVFKSGEVPYFHKKEKDDVDIEESIGYRKVQFERHQRGIWAYIIEAFAAHCDHLNREFEFGFGNDFKVAISERQRVCKIEGQTYMCIPDLSFDEVRDYSRGSADDIASLNWYAYDAAKGSVFEWVEKHANARYKVRRIRQTQVAIADYEWRNIKKILSYAHLFDYPRPSNDRMGYLFSCGVTEVPLVLA